MMHDPINIIKMSAGRYLVIDVSVQPTSSIFKGTAFQEQCLEQADA